MGKVMLEPGQVQFRAAWEEAERLAYDALLHRTYLREGFPPERFMPTPDVQRYGLFDEAGAMVAICGLKRVVGAREAQFEGLIGLTSDPARQTFEVVNVVVTKPHYGTFAFSALIRGASEAALAKGATLLVGVTRAALLKPFVQFGLYPAVHAPLDVLGGSDVQSFVVYYDFSAPGAVAYMRARADQVSEQSRRMALLRRRYIRRDRPPTGQAPAGGAEAAEGASGAPG